MMRRAAEPIAETVRARIVDLAGTITPLSIEQTALATIVGAAQGLMDVSRDDAAVTRARILAALNKAEVLGRSQRRQ